MTILICSYLDGLFVLIQAQFSLLALLPAHHSGQGTRPHGEQQLEARELGPVSRFHDEVGRDLGPAEQPQEGGRRQEVGHAVEF